MMGESFNERFDRFERQRLLEEIADDYKPMIPSGRFEFRDMTQDESPTRRRVLVGISGVSRPHVSAAMSPAPWMQSSCPVPAIQITLYVNGQATAFNLRKEATLLDACRAFMGWLQHSPMIPNGPELMKRFLIQFVEQKLDEDVFELTARLGRSVTNKSFPEAVENLAPWVETMLLQAASSFEGSNKGTDKSTLMRDAAAQVVQERINVSLGYGARSQEHKDRVAVLEGIRDRINALDPRDL